MQLAPFEEKMWESLPAKTRTKMSDHDINHKYELRENRILPKSTVKSFRALSRH
jgi:hypothetical protein